MPFPITTSNSDTTSWTWLRENAVRIGAKCQRRKLDGSGGYKIGLGKNANTAIVVFRLPRPPSLPYNYRASLSPTNEAAWSTLYNFMEGIAFPSGEPADPNEPSSSTHQSTSSLAVLDIIAQDIEWGVPPPGTHEITGDEITPAALEYFPGGINDGSHGGHGSAQGGDIEQ
ncbi:MAG: hypothetical protein M1835_000771, partial [Candelina submexicana]